MDLILDITEMCYRVFPANSAIYLIELNKLQCHAFIPWPSPTGLGSVHYNCIICILFLKDPQWDRWNHLFHKIRFSCLVHTPDWGYYWFFKFVTFQHRCFSPPFLFFARVWTWSLTMERSILTLLSSYVSTALLAAASLASGELNQKSNFTNFEIKTDFNNFLIIKPKN